MAAAFSALTAEGGVRHCPFRWQERLLGRLIGADLPDAVDVPTGLGKTSVMALWLMALGEGAKLPRRLVYVVDRRAVVDQATRYAELLRFNMPADLAARLGLAGGGSALPISTLRGGFADNRDWLEDPSKPAIVVGTIDMIGSRLLFEGYGVSRAMRPYHAGFLGVDTLVLLDEAHLCPPFESLLSQVASGRDGKLGPRSRADSSTPPFRLMSLSATGRELAEMPAESVFRLAEEDAHEPVVHQRLTARKRLKVTELEDARQLTEFIARRAIELGGGGTPSRVLVYCHSRTDAVAVKVSIDKEFVKRTKAGALPDGHVSELLVGERRVYERKGLEAWLDGNGFLGGVKTPPVVPTFLNATSAGEVGVDLDADHMVCDLVAYERMVQRLGRVNRRGGEDRAATVDVFAVRSEAKTNSRRGGKGDAEKGLETYKRRLAPLLRLPRGEDDRHDASPSATVGLKRSHPDVVDAATTPVPLFPELTRPLVDAWSMTSLKRHEGRPEVAPWLRGWEDDDDPQTDVVWRRHLPYIRTDTATSLSPAMAGEYFRVAPVHATERLEAASSRVFDWLLKRVGQVAKRNPDHDMAVRDEEVVAIVLDRTGEHVAGAKFSDLRHIAAPVKGMSRSEQRDRDRSKREWRDRLLPGALLIVDARLGGLSDGMLDEKSESEVATADADEGWREEREDSSSERSRPVIRFRIEKVTGGEDDEGLKPAAQREDWRHVRTFETRFDGGGVAQGGLAVFKWPDEVADEDSRSILSAPQTLASHSEDAAARAREIAERLGLPAEEIDAISVAARLHDDGKAATRWQNAMNAPRDDRRPYAKTAGGGNWRLLEGYRHEFGSLVRAERTNLPEGTRDLVLHLIAAHHGNARPFISSAGREDGPPSLLESRAGDAALRFARLQKRYGPWGLAWREAILRAADQSVSREWSERHGKAAGG